MKTILFFIVVSIALLSINQIAYGQVNSTASYSFCGIGIDTPYIDGKFIDNNHDNKDDRVQYHESFMFPTNDTDILKARQAYCQEVNQTTISIKGWNATTNKFIVNQDWLDKNNITYNSQENQTGVYRQKLLSYAAKHDLWSDINMPTIVLEEVIKQLKKECHENMDLHMNTTITFGHC